jgi:hypothetical protein
MAGSYSRKTIQASAAPSDDERQALEARLGALLSILKPADENALKRSIGAMRAAFPAANDGYENAMMTVNLYVAALKSFPEWVVNDACRKALTGTLGANPGFAPTPPQLAQACREIAGPYMAERGKVEAILNAEVAKHTTAEDRARAVARWEAMRPSFTAKENAPSKETPEQALERLMATKDTPFAIGGELLKKIELIKQGA